jgi:hypothetical protein
MIFRGRTWAVVIACFVHESLGETDIDFSSPGDRPERLEWEYSLSTSTYLLPHGRDFANPNLTADHDWLHLEARYNYEAQKTGSLWFGYNFSFGEKLVVEATPMFGGVFGDITGIAPGYVLAVSYKGIELFTQGEYFIDAARRDGNFFYTWTEVSVAPVEWLRLGLVIDRTKAFGSDLDIRRGPLIGFTYRKVDFTTYWLSPGSTNSAIVFSVTVNF